MFDEGIRNPDEEPGEGEFLAANADTLGALVGVLSTTVSGSAKCTPAGLTDKALMSTALELERCRSLLEATAGHMAAELDTRRCTVDVHGLKTGQYLAIALSSDGKACDRRVRIANDLRAWFPEIDEALRTGFLSWDHVVAIHQGANPRIRSLLAEIQPDIIESAQGTVFKHWLRRFRLLCQILDADGGHDPSNDVEASKLKVSQTTFGVYLSGELVGSAALIVHETITTVTQELFNKYSADKQQAGPGASIPPPAALRALALVEICRRSNATDVSNASPPGTQASIVVRKHDHPNGTCSHTVETESGLKFTSSQVEEIRCDEHLTPIIVDRKGLPLHVGRSRRLATAAQRKAVFTRDGGCVFPGCDAPGSWCVQHHVKPWSEGGRTDLDNLATLCPHHHGLTHSNGWQMNPAPNQTFTWTTPLGRLINSQRHGKPAIRPPE